MKKNKCTAQQAKFIEAMTDPKTKNPTQAAIKAGCPPKNARITASRWLTKAYISDAINERKQRAMEHSQVTSEEVLGSAVFQMRSSMDDLLDENGSFSIEKARTTGAIDLLKRHKETIKTFTDKDGNTETIKTVEVEMLTNQDGRKEVANYIGLENLPNNSRQQSPEQLARELYAHLSASHFDSEIILEVVSEHFPEVPVRLLLGDGIER